MHRMNSKSGTVAMSHSQSSSYDSTRFTNPDGQDEYYPTEDGYDDKSDRYMDKNDDKSYTDNIQTDKMHKTVGAENSSKSIKETVNSNSMKYRNEYNTYVQQQYDGQYDDTNVEAAYGSESYDDYVNDPENYDKAAQYGEGDYVYPPDENLCAPYGRNKVTTYDENTGYDSQYDSLPIATESEYAEGCEAGEGGLEDLLEEEEELDEDEDYEEDDELESEGEESDEDVTEAVNSIGDLEDDIALETENAENSEPHDIYKDDIVPPEQSTQLGTLDGGEKKKRKRKKGEGGRRAGQKSKRKRKGEPGEGGEKKKVDVNARRNIRKILSEHKLEKETLDAQAAELERQHRLQDLKRQMTPVLLPDKEAKKEKDSQLKSLLQVAEEDAEKDGTVLTAMQNEDKMMQETKIHRDGVVIDISSGEDSDDDVVMVPSDEEELDEMFDDDLAEVEDVNNSGGHINDMFNVPDNKGRVLVNVGHPTADPDIFLSNFVATHIKPHQIGGVRFLYDNLVECFNRFKTSSGFGCILAHSMGLGKTIQMIGFIDIFLRHTSARTVIVIVPINTLANWLAEFNMWVPDKEICEKYSIPPEVTSPRPYEVFLLNDNFKNTPARAKVVDTWYKNGGVLLLGYEMYRLLSSKKVHLQKTKGRKKLPGSDVIDVDEEDRDKKLLINIHEALVNPGPDLVVCDEGHRIKNSHAGISQSLKLIRTKRRIVLTGYPLQNNLIEYWCMVDFVRPNFLGTKTEFCNMFERPIMNGQCADSTPQDVRLMRYRAHVLHSLLEGFVQRRGHTVLQAALPPKEEYVFLIRMSPIQKRLYEKFMESIEDANSNGWVNNNPLKAFSVCCKIWNHPDILYTCMKKSLDDNDLDIETGEPKKKGGRGLKSKKENLSAFPNPMPDDIGLLTSIMSQGRSNEPCITYDWANAILKDYEPGLLHNGGKMVILFNLIQESLKVGDKILVFSQSLFTLNLIEEFLSKYKVPRPELDEYWCRNKNYFRLDGSTSSSDREKLINAFNNEPNKWVFLLSTRAGSLGINLVGANRVVVLDASWNPCHDCQAICRVYRFGQVKPSYVYRLVTENTMEKKIYDRQVNKQGMANRVVDELNPQNQFRKEHVDKLMVYEDKDFPPVDITNMEEECNDHVMMDVLSRESHWLTSKPFSHESLLIDRKELKLTMKEKRLAKQSYVMEKRLNVSYSRPSYTQYYPESGSPYHETIGGRDGMIERPIASVKPMISTPMPMRPNIVAAPQILKPGVSVHQVLTTTEIILPGTNTMTEAGTSEPKKIPAGQQVVVIRTPKGVYIRTPDGKIFAVRSKPQTDSTSPLDTLANTGSTMNTGGLALVRPPNVIPGAFGQTSSGVTMIRPNLVAAAKPLTMIRQAPGLIRAIIPVTVGNMTTITSTGSQNLVAQIAPTSLGPFAMTTVAHVSTMSTQSQTANASIQGPNETTSLTSNANTVSSGGSRVGAISNAGTINGAGTGKVSSSISLQNLSRGVESILPTGPSSGGLMCLVKPKQVSSKIFHLPLNTFEAKMDMGTNIVSTQRDNDDQDWTAMETFWNLPSADDNIQDLSLVNVPGFDNGNKQITSVQSDTDIRQKPFRYSQGLSALGQISDIPDFSLSRSPESAASGSPSPIDDTLLSIFTSSSSQQRDHNSMSSRPSDIDLHEMKLTSMASSSTNLVGTSGGQQSLTWHPNSHSSMLPMGTNQNQGRYHPNLFQDTTTQTSAAQQGGLLNPGLSKWKEETTLNSDALFDLAFSNVSVKRNRLKPELKQSTSTVSVNPNNETGQGHLFSNSGNLVGGKYIADDFMGDQTQNNSFKIKNGSNLLSDVSTNTPVQSQNTDVMADFTISGIHDNSTFLSELTDFDDSFLSQFGENSNQSNSSSSIGGLSGGLGKFGNAEVQSRGLAAQNAGHQQQSVDMFSGNQQQHSSYFPNFSNSAGNQFSRNSGFGDQQNIHLSQQAGFPGGSVYQMMQPGMFPYPSYGYSPLMAPLPYYPMTFQPQYGTQSTNINMSAGTLGIGQQGEGPFHSGTGN